MDRWILVHWKKILIIYVMRVFFEDYAESNVSLRLILAVTNQ